MAIHDFTWRGILAGSSYTVLLETYIIFWSLLHLSLLLNLCSDFINGVWLFRDCDGIAAYLRRL